MDISQLAAKLVTLLAPALPYLIQFSEYAVQEAGKKLGEDTWKQAKTIWSKMSPKVAQSPSADKAVQGILRDSTDQKYKDEFSAELEKLFAGDAELATEILDLLKNKSVIQIIEVEGKIGKNVKQRATGKSSVQQRTSVKKDGVIVGDVEQEA